MTEEDRIRDAFEKHMDERLPGWRERSRFVEFRRTYQMIEIAFAAGWRTAKKEDRG